LGLRTETRYIIFRVVGDELQDSWQEENCKTGSYLLLPTH